MENEKMTPLDVSKQLKDFVLSYTKNGLDRRFIIGSFSIIENVLGEYEALKPRLIHPEQVFQDYKELKALDIIRRIVKSADEPMPPYEENSVFTKEEYDLLKEVLLCQQ